MENLFLAVVTAGALYVIYKRLFTSDGCNCENGKSCCKPDKED